MTPTTGLEINWKSKMILIIKYTWCYTWKFRFMYITLTVPVVIRSFLHRASHWLVKFVTCIIIYIRSTRHIYGNRVLKFNFVHSVLNTWILFYEDRWITIVIRVTYALCLAMDYILFVKQIRPQTMPAVRNRSYDCICNMQVIQHLPTRWKLFGYSSI